MKRGLLASAFAAAAMLSPSLAGEEPVISQRGIRFTPSRVALRAGSSLTIVNDDDNIVHHAYVESDSFNFDSGDQRPGDQAKITFPVPGTFSVLCGVHPKMSLDVIVEPAAKPER